jgi:hypothetical protein
MVQRIPSKPDYLSQADFDYIVARDKRQCVYYGDCPHAKNGSACCDEAVDFDHEQPVELGGDDTPGNVRLLCSSVNRGRPVEPMKKWAESNHWDNPALPGKLREIQQLAGWMAIDDLQYLIEHPPHLRRLLLGSTTFIPGATGIGKCILCQSVFFRINKLIGLDSPRIKNVLWLTNDTTLRDAAKGEIEADASEHGFASPRPSVHIAKEFADISKGPNGSDVKVATAQSLWKVETQDGLRRTDTEIKDALRYYDSVVFDECDWANDQVRRIARLAGHMLQISLTASPRCDDEDFLRRFVLIAPGAVADYTRARDLDQCLKFLGKITIAAPHDKYKDREKGKLRPQVGRMEPDHVLFRSAISEAVRHADQEETRMRAVDPDNYYSPHIMVRMKEIINIRTMYDDLKEQLRTMHERGEIKNQGWDVSFIFRGHERYLPRECRNERELTAKDKNKKYVHPFMIACDNNGRATSRSKRILIMCNIGVRGINNWTISHIVDCTDTTALAELIQFNWGRPLRWKNRREWINEGGPKSEFAAVYNFIPQSEFQEDKLEALSAAKDFVENMLNVIGSAGFLTWQDLLEGRRVTDDDVTIDLTNRPLTNVEKFQIQKSVSEAVAAAGAALPGLAELAINQSQYSGSLERLRNKMIEYGQRLIDKEEFRKSEVAASRIIEEFKQRPANVMEKLEPQDKYDVEDLKRWVKNDPDYDELRADYIAELDAGTKTTIHSVSQRLRDTQIANYRPAARTRRLQGTKELYGDDWGVLNEIAAELHGQMKDSNQYCEIREVNKAANGAANFIFQIRADNGGPMDHPAYHIAILGRYRDKLQRLARSRLIDQGLLGQPLKRFTDT